MVAATSEVLRVGAAWGTTIVGVKLLKRGQDCVLGGGKGALAAPPDDLNASVAPLRAVGRGWELDARGALSGILFLRGREESVSGLALAGAAVPVVPGDYGLLQYGLFSVFFQYTSPAPAITRRWLPLFAPFVFVARFLRDDPLAGLSFFSSIVFHLGVIGLLIFNWTPEDYRLPPELVSAEDYAARFGLKRILPEMESPLTKADGGLGVKVPKEPGARDTKKAGGGQKHGAEGRAGLGGKEERAELPSERRVVTRYGGLSEALADTGTDIKRTLSEIQTVSDALGGLNSGNVVLGGGPGAGLRGTGGGGTGVGVMFGSGTLNTGWVGGAGGGFGAGNGRAGYGSGAGGAGGAGLGGGAINGPAGRGPSEHGVQTTATGASHGGLSPEAIRRVVLAHQGALKACYEIEAQKDPGLKGGVTISWTIDPGGSVTSATASSSTIHNARVEGCVLRQVRTWHFPSSEGSSQPTFPFVFGIGR